MKYLIVILLLLGIKGECQNKIAVTQKGWHVYRYGDLLAFLPLKDQSKTPTYSNFLLEEKGDGQRLNNMYHAPAKLLIAKIFWIDTYQYDSNSKKDTTDYLAGGWTFRINGKSTFTPVWHFMERSGDILFLNRSDSLFAEKGGRRKNIEIYPPH